MCADYEDMACHCGHTSNDTHISESRKIIYGVKNDVNGAPINYDELTFLTNGGFIVSKERTLTEEEPLGFICREEEFANASTDLPDINIYGR